MSLLTDFSRVALYGVDMSKEKPSLETVAFTWLENKFRSLVGLNPKSGHTFGHLVEHHTKSLFAGVVGQDEAALPGDFPPAVWETIDSVLKTRGGMDRNGGYNYYLSREECKALPHLWQAQIECSPMADPGKISSFEESVEDALSKKGLDLNIRFQFKPLRVQIDRPSPKNRTLRQQWEFISTDPRIKANCGWTMPALLWNNAGEEEVVWLDLGSTEGFSQAVFGSSGSGKSQLALSMILSTCMINSPERLSLVIIDPKGVDFPVLGSLPHIACPVITDAEEGVAALQAIVAEMDRRVKLAKAGQRNFPRILLFVDELADLLMVGGDEIENSLIRLAQKGRALGISLILGSQRAVGSAFPADVLNNMACRWCGRLGSASESVFASGVAGTTTNRLPGKGAFEIYSPEFRGTRVQALFVADSKLPSYEAEINAFIDDIKARWTTQCPGWTPGRTVPAPEAVSAAPATATEPESPASKIEIDARIWQRMTEAYSAGKLTGNMVRKLYQEILDKSISGTKAKEVLEAFTGAMQDSMATSGD